LLAVFATVYFYLLRYHCRFPAERLHLMEYGLLAYLSYRVLRFDFPRASAYVLGFLLSSGFGFMDEVIQYFLPNRVFELRDVVTNVAASALGLLVVGVLLRADSSGDSRREGGT
jgi:VanZ family protein